MSLEANFNSDYLMWCLCFMIIFCCRDAEVRFMTLEDGQTAQELATSRGWPALLYGPG